MESFKKNNNQFENSRHYPSGSLVLNEKDIKIFYNTEKIKSLNINLSEDRVNFPVDKMFETEEDKIDFIKKDVILSQNFELDNISFFNNINNESSKMEKNIILAKGITQNPIMEENSNDEALQRLNPEKSELKNGRKIYFILFYLNYLRSIICSYK